LLNIQNVSFSYKYFSIFVGGIVEVFSQSDVIGQAKKTPHKTRNKKKKTLINLRLDNA
jgi:hypothetical protein